MKFKKLLLLIAIITVVTNCSKEDKPIIVQESEEITPPEESNEETYFTYYLTGPESAPKDIWVIIHDSEGELVDYKPRNDTGIYEFTTNKGEAPETFTVTVLYSNELSSQAIHNIYSFPDIKKGSVWNKDFKAIIYTVFNDSFDLTIKNLPGVRRFNVFERTDSITGIEDTIINENDGSKTLVLNNVKLSDNNDYIISIYDTEGKLKYTRLTAQNMDVLSLDYNDFKEFDSIFQAELPKSGDIRTSTTGYFEENPNYYNKGLGLNEDSSYSDNILVGYLDDYKKFQTSINIDFGDYSYDYVANGAKVSNFSILEKPNLDIINEDIEDFEFSTNLSFNRKLVGWQYNTGNLNEDVWIYTNWFIYSNNETRTSLGSLPDEILENHQFLSIDKLKLRFVRMFSQSESHNEWIEKTKTTFEDSSDSILEYVTISF